MDMMSTPSERALAEAVRDRLSVWAAQGTALTDQPDLTAQLHEVGLFDASKTLTDVHLAFRELGRVLGPLHIWAQFVAIRATARLSRMSGMLESCERRAALAVPAMDEPGTYLVVDGSNADVFICVGTTGVSVMESSNCVDVGDSERFDPSTPVQRVVTDLDTVARLEGPEAWRTLGASGAALLAGSALETSEIATHYALQRHQFGRPIGSFQAVKHRCVDLALRAEAITAQSAMAAIACDAQQRGQQLQTLAAASVGVRSALENAMSAVQVLGGIGFTSGHPVHLHVRRAYVIESVFGGRRAIGRQLAEPVSDDGRELVDRYSAVSSVENFA